MSALVARSRRPGCPSNLELDELVAGDLGGDEREGRLRAHVGGCAACNARLSAFAAVEPPPASASLRSEARRAARPERGALRRRGVLGALGVLGAAAAVLIVWPRAPTSPLRTKGGLALTIFIKGEGAEVDAVQGEGKLHPGDELRFALATSAAGHAVVLGLDAAPSVTVYVPGANDAAARAVPVGATGGGALPGSIVADETTGAERVFAVLCPTPPDPRSLRLLAVTALARAEGRPDRVKALESGCLEASVLLHKEPRPR